MSDQERSEKIEKLQQELNEDYQYSLFFDALIDIFSDSQGTVTGKLDPQAGAVQTSTFNDVINANAHLRHMQTLVANNHNKSLAGLYAMVMQKHEVLLDQQDSEVENIPAPRTNSGWGYALNKLSRGLSVLSNIGEQDPPPTLNDIIDEASSGLEILDFPEYYIYVFSNIADNNPVPTVVEQNRTIEGRSLGPIQITADRTTIERKFVNVDAYPKAMITSKRLRDEEELTSGTIVRVSFEASDNSQKLIIQEIVENSTVFTELTMRSLGARSAILTSELCRTDSALTNTTHAIGDVIGEESNVPELRIVDNIIYPYTQGATVNLVVFAPGSVYTYDDLSKRSYLYKKIQELAPTDTMFLLPASNPPNEVGINWTNIENAINTLETEHNITFNSKSVAAFESGIFGLGNAIIGAPNGYFDGGLFLAEPRPFAPTQTNTFVNALTRKGYSGRVHVEYNISNWDAAVDGRNWPSFISTMNEGAGVVFPPPSSGQNPNQILESVLNKVNNLPFNFTS
tara:strand:- start:1823 stop:3361 length:1539 start_codon:yes stop_codon:yes gene_type:complete